MIEKIKTYLIGKLTAAGIKRPPFETHKALTGSGAVHLGAVLMEDEKLVWDGSKKTYTDEDGNRIKRICKFTRTNKVLVIIGEKDEGSCSEIYTTFLSLLDKGFDDGDGNWVTIEILSTEWMTDEDHILKSKIAVQLVLEITSGIYNDVLLQTIGGLELTN